MMPAKKIANGIDPSFEKQLQKANAQALAENTFQAVALEWHEIQSERWSDNYAKKVMQGLNKNIFPYIGRRPIAEIEPPELLACLRHAESRGSHDIVGRSKQICGQVFKYGIQTGRCTRDSSVDLTGALKSKKREHFRTLDFSDVPLFLRCLVPHCGGIMYKEIPTKETLWDKYCMEAPERQRSCVEQYKIVKRV